MPTRPVKIGNILAQAQLLIEGAQNNQSILDALAPFNYGPPRLQELHTLLTEARTLSAEKNARYGKQEATTAEVEELRGQADAVYKIARRLARIALDENVDARTALQLAGPRPKSLPGYIHQARSFYENLLKSEAHLKQMANFGYTREKLQAEQKLVETLAALDVAQEEKKGEARGGTKTRDEKLDQLGVEISKLKAVARIALEGRKPDLVKLGLDRAEGTRDSGPEEEPPVPGS